MDLVTRKSSEDLIVVDGAVKSAKFEEEEREG